MGIWGSMATISSGGTSVMMNSAWRKCVCGVFAWAWRKRKGKREGQWMRKRKYIMDQSDQDES